MSIDTLRKRLDGKIGQKKSLEEKKKVEYASIKTLKKEMPIKSANDEPVGDAVERIKEHEACIAECNILLEANRGAIEILRQKITEEKARLRVEHLAELDKQIAAPIAVLLRDSPKVDAALTKLVDACHERFYAPGFIHNIDRKIPGFDQLPRCVEREFRLQMGEKLNAIAAGTLLAPVDDFKDDAPDEPELSRKEILEHELKEAKRRLPVLVENRQHISEYAPYGDGLIKFENEAEVRGAAVDSCYAEIRRLETELANLGAEGK